MSPRKRKEFCKIISCINNKGTADKNERMFRFVYADNIRKF